MKINKVYHIPDPREPDNIDLGYVGVSTEPEQRFRSHCESNYVVGNAIRKHNIVFKDVKILGEFDKESAYLFENKLRPKKNLGWNIAAGGIGGWVGCSTEESLAKKAESYSKTSKIIEANGKSKAQNQADKAAATSTSTILENGNTIAEQGALDAANTMAEIQEDGKTIREKASESMKETLSVIGDDGLTIAQRRAPKTQESRIKNGTTQNGEGNSMFGKVPVVDLFDSCKKTITREEFANNKDRYFSPRSKVYQNMKKNGEIVNI